MGLFPRNDKYFELLNQFVAKIHEGADLFVQLFNDLQHNEVLSERIKEIEKECDRHSAGIIELLNGSYITPLDREDIYTLATELDDIMDMINEIARLTCLYGVHEATPPAARLAAGLRDAVIELEKAFTLLKSRHDVRPHIDRIRELEEESDRVSQEAIRGLFANGLDALHVIKWLRIYEELESSLDRCKKVAKVLAGILVKNS